jgi:EAL domain-containing protein (putative c-di-GMP-specific phosphodiesterase class I)
LTIDDFGIGYSSLNHLQRLPIDALKIDRSFVAGITPAALVAPNAPDTAVIRATCSLAQSMGIHVAAVGVEAEHQREFLLRLGCRAMQGFLFGNPVPAARAETYWQLLPPSATRAA